MNPDPNRHEASREAFEERAFPNLKYCLRRGKDGEYLNDVVKHAWCGWKIALDWQAAQVCGWTHDATNEEYDTDCARSFRCVVYGWDCVPGFCPACGRRVKIMDNSETTP